METWLSIGGEITEYTQLLEDARRQAIDRMSLNARRLNANAIIMMRFDSSELGQAMSEIVAYGTAAIIEPNRASEDLPVPARPRA